MDNNDDTKKEFIEWLDPRAIADTIESVLEDNEIPVTLEKMQEVWLGVLDAISDEISSVVLVKLEMDENYE